MSTLAATPLSNSTPRPPRPRPVQRASQAAPAPSARSAKPTAAATGFSWQRAGHFFGQGLVHQAKELVMTPLRHPLAALGVVAATAAVMVSAPVIGLSAVAVGNFMLVSFGALAAIRLIRGVAAAIGDWRHGDVRRAEQDFAEIGKGSLDLALAVGPAAVGKGIGWLRRSEAGNALSAVWRDGKASQTIGKSLSRIEKWQGPLPELRGQIAESAVVRGFNHLFETLPARFSGRLDAWAIGRIDASRAGESVRNWGLRRLASARGTEGASLGPDALIALRGARPIPTTGGRPPANFAVVGDGVLRGGAVTSAEDLAYMVREHKLAAIVSLLDPNNPKEIALLALERRLAAEQGIKLVHVPLPFQQEPPAAMVRQVFAAIEEVQGRSKGATILVHCRNGRDRTGAMIGAYRITRQGFTNEQALAEMVKFGHDTARDPYLAYLSHYVLNIGKTATTAVTRLFLVGTMATSASRAAAVLPASLPALAKASR